MTEQGLNTVRLMIETDPWPSVKVVDKQGGQVDLTQSWVSGSIDLDPVRGFVATIVVGVDPLVYDFPTQVAVQTQERLLDKLTAEDLDGAIASGGMSQSPGKKVLAYLRHRAGLD